MTEDLVPLRLPHFALREGHLFFLVDPQPVAELEPEDAALWERMDGSATVQQLGAGHGDVAARLRRFVALGACERAPGRFPGHRRRVLVIEPHMDDAVLSVGGTMWSQRAVCEFTVATIAGRSNFTYYFVRDGDLFDTARVTALRRAESALALRMLGGRHVSLDEPDATLRYQPGDWTLDWYRRNRQGVEAYRDHAGAEEEIGPWAAAIEQLLTTTAPDEAWLPLGVGNHSDHERVRDAALRALARLPGLEGRTALYLYQDVPYATRFPAHTGQIVAAIAAAGGALEPRPTEVGAAMEAKLRLCSIYASQFTPNYIIPKIEEAARQAAPTGAGPYELRFALRRVPGAVNPLAVYSGRQAVERLVPRLRPWYRRHRSARRIRILAPDAVGRWAEDLGCLLEAFAGATLEVHVSEINAAETARRTSPRIEVRPVPRGAWRRRLVRIAASRPCPLILLAGENRRAAALLTRVACGLSHPLVADRMGHLVLALRLVAAD